MFRVLAVAPGAGPRRLPLDVLLLLRHVARVQEVEVDSKHNQHNHHQHPRQQRAAPSTRTHHGTQATESVPVCVCVLCVRRSQQQTANRQRHRRINGVAQKGKCFGFQPFFPRPNKQTKQPNKQGMATLTGREMFVASLRQRTGDRGAASARGRVNGAGKPSATPFLKSVLDDLHTDPFERALRRDTQGYESSRSGGGNSSSRRARHSTLQSTYGTSRPRTRRRDQSTSRTRQPRS